MRQCKFVGAVLLAVVAAMAILASTALAATEFLGNVAGNTFKIKSGAGKLEGGPVPIECKSDQGTGEVLSATHVDVTVDFLECSVLGQAANSLGDKSGVILIGALALLCILKESPTLEIGLFTELKNEVHIEIPNLGVLALVKGTVIGSEVLPLNKKQLTGTVNYKSPNPTECGGKKAQLLESENGGTAKAATEVTKEEITYAKEIEVMG